MSSENPKPKRPKTDWGNFAVFVVITGLFSTWFWGSPAGALARLEFRQPVELPAITPESALEVETFEQIEAWAKDNVRVKPDAIRLVNDTVAAYFPTASSPKVIYGAEWKPDRGRELFSSAEFTDVCRSEPDMDLMRSTLDRLTAAAAETGKEVYFVVAPSKYRVLGKELLGDRFDALTYCALRNYAITAQLAAEYPDLIHLVTPKRVMYYASDSPYWVGDTHWTPKAARALSEIVLMKAANLSRPAATKFLFDRLEVKGTKAMGGLFRLAGSKKTTEETLLKPKKQFVFKMKRNPLFDPQTFTWNSKKAVPGADESITILHDSFVLVPRATTHFGSAFSFGVDVHWNNHKDLENVPVTKTLIIESVDRTFLSHLASATNLEDLATQKDSMEYVIRYLARTS